MQVLRWDHPQGRVDELTALPRNHRLANLGREVEGDEQSRPWALQPFLRHPLDATRARRDEMGHDCNWIAPNGARDAARGLESGQELPTRVDRPRRRGLLEGREMPAARHLGPGAQVGEDAVGPLAAAPARSRAGSPRPPPGPRSARRARAASDRAPRPSRGASRTRSSRSPSRASGSRRARPWRTAARRRRRNRDQRAVLLDQPGREAGRRVAERRRRARRARRREAAGGSPRELATASPAG